MTMPDGGQSTSHPASASTAGCLVVGQIVIHNTSMPVCNHDYAALLLLLALVA